MLSFSLSLSLVSLSKLNLPLEYPMGPFYKGKFCDRARETTNTVTATRKRVTEREREAAHERRTTNENKSEQTKRWTKRLRSLVRVEKRQKQGILCCHRRGRCCLPALPFWNSINQSFIFSFTSFSHFLFDATDASAACKRTKERSGNRNAPEERLGIWFYCRIN